MSTGSSLAAIFLADVLQITITRPGGKGLVVMAVISRKKGPRCNFVPFFFLSKFTAFPNDLLLKNHSSPLSGRQPSVSFTLNFIHLKTMELWNFEI